MGDKISPRDLTTSSQFLCNLWKQPLEGPFSTHFQVFLPERVYFLIKNRCFLTCSTGYLRPGNSTCHCAIRERDRFQLRASVPPCKHMKNLQSSQRKKIPAAFLRNIVKDFAGSTAAWEQCLWQSYKLMNKLKGFRRVIQVSSQTYWTQEMILPGSGRNN